MSLDTKVKNLIINTNMTKEQYEAVDDKSNQLFFVEDSSVVDVPAPEENQSGYLHTDGVNLTWKEIESGGDDYLPLSGGTLTGDLTFKKAGFTDQTLSIGSVNALSTSSSFQCGKLYPKSPRNTDIGESVYRWRTIYVTAMNNGSDLAVPTEGGTLARVEDLPQASSMPVAASSNAGNVLQYIGETTDKYTNGYFYKSTNDIIQNWFTTGYAQYDTSLTLIVTVDQEKFLAQNPVWQDMGEDTKVWRADYDESTDEWYVWTQQPNIYISNANLKDTWGIDVTNAAGDYVPASGDTLLIQLSETEEFMWEQVNVQPTPEVDTLPDQTDNAGKFLTTDGTTASWGGGKITNTETAFGANATTYVKSVAIGSNAQATSAGAIAIGAGSKATTGLAIAIGCNASSLAANAIQLGNATSYVGAAHTNEDANTFKVGNANGNFEMMDADGNVPLERLTYVTNQIGDISTALTAILGE